MRDDRSFSFSAAESVGASRFVVGHQVTIRAGSLRSKAMRLLQTLDPHGPHTLARGSSPPGSPRRWSSSSPGSTRPVPTSRRSPAAWSRLWLATAGCTLEVVGGELVDQDPVPHRCRQSPLSAGHHGCFLAVPVPIRFLAKKELFRIPILAPAMRASGSSKWIAAPVRPYTSR